MIETYISSIFDGLGKAYIYLWVSKINKVIYVGMTNSRSGTLGRAGAHVQTKGTLRKRFLENNGLNIEKVKDFKLLTFRLPEKSEYTSVERSYREAVEYLVQKKLISIRGTLAPTFDVISWVRDSPRTNNFEVKLVAERIVDEFILAYSAL